MQTRCFEWTVSKSIRLPVIPVVQSYHGLGSWPPAYPGYNGNKIFPNDGPGFIEPVNIPVNIFCPDRCVDHRPFKPENVFSDNGLNNINKSSHLFPGILLTVGFRYIHKYPSPFCIDPGFNTRYRCVEVEGKNIQPSFFVQFSTIFLKFIVNTSHIRHTQLAQIHFPQRDLGCK